MSPTSYAIVHLDGMVLDVQIGVLLAYSSPVAKFMVVAGHQWHPVWALDRVAVTVYAYFKSARAHGYESVQASITGTLLSNESVSNVLARSMTWHTSAAVRADAEREIAHLNGAWPGTRTMTPPVALFAFLDGRGA